MEQSNWVIDFINAIGKNGAEFIQNQLWLHYDALVDQKVKQFKEDLLKKRDEVVAGTILHIWKSMEMYRGNDNIVFTIRNVDKDGQ